MVRTSKVLDIYRTGADAQHAHLFDICQGRRTLGGRPKTLPAVDIPAPACCAPVATGAMTDDDALQVALRLKALADPVRVKILSLLFGSPARPGGSGGRAAALGLSESTVSHHLTQLRKVGLIESDRRGMNVFHRVTTEALGALCAVLDP